MIQFILFIIILFYLYFRYLIYVIDFFSGILAAVVIWCNGFRMKVIDYNLKKVFPNMSDKRKSEIKFKSLKIFFINLFLVLHQRLLLNNSLDFITNRFISGDNFIDKKRILACAHLGIIWHPVSFNKRYGSNSFMFKNNIKFLEKIFLPKKIFNSYEIYPCKNNEMSILKKSPVNNFIIICDQRGNSNELNFLNHKLKIFNSPSRLHYDLNIPLYCYFAIYNFKLKKIKEHIIKIKIDDNDNVQSVTQKIADVFTKFIFNYPEQYFWAHNIFRVKF